MTKTNQPLRYIGGMKHTHFIIGAIYRHDIHTYQNGSVMLLGQGKYEYATSSLLYAQWEQV